MFGGNIVVDLISRFQVIKSTLKLGILYFTWASEHYNLDNIKSAIMVDGFEIQDIQHIGHSVYEPSANYYYIQNRQLLRQRLKTKTFPYAKISAHRICGKDF